MTERSRELESACKDYEEDLVLHYYGECGDADRKRIVGHLTDCTRCRHFVDDLQRLLPQMGKTEEMPQVFWDNYYRETIAKLDAQDERKPWWRSCLVFTHGWMVPAFGTVGIIVLIVGLLFGRGNLSIFNDRSPVKIPQEVLVDSNQLEFFKSMDLLESLDRLEQQDGTKGELNNTHTERVSFDRQVT
ncbi:MAG TPA: hypothetical protein VMT22_20465 [Terriglobales bacterium]|jgi:hypothetical protein|nr:hypothetical protein [Terriglobales bacterium]